MAEEKKENKVLGVAKTAMKGIKDAPTSTKVLAGVGSAVLSVVSFIIGRKTGGKSKAE